MRGALQGSAGGNGGRDVDLIGNHHKVGTAGIGDSAGTTSKQGADTGAVDEGDGIGGVVHGVVSAGDQARAVTTIDQQVGRRQAAAHK
ncbi:hypothetical protein D3C80_553080 [compost metagenome]